MPNRRMWSPEEDHTLRLLREEKSLKKWSVIARKMETDYNLPGRTGKQCRERYQRVTAGITITSTRPSEPKTGLTMKKSLSTAFTTS